MSPINNKMVFVILIKLFLAVTVKFLAFSCVDALRTHARTLLYETLPERLSCSSLIHTPNCQVSSVVNNGVMNRAPLIHIFGQNLNT